MKLVASTVRIELEEVRDEETIYAASSPYWQAALNAEAILPVGRQGYQEGLSILESSESPTASVTMTATGPTPDAASDKLIAAMKDYGMVLI